MKIDWKKQGLLIQRALVFILGFGIIGQGGGSLLTYLFGDWVKSISVDDIKAYLSDPERIFTHSSCSVYLIAYVLFYTLPDKVKKANLWFRAIYFVLFYLFCILVYFSI